MGDTGNVSGSVCADVCRTWTGETRQKFNSDHKGHMPLMVASIKALLAAPGRRQKSALGGASFKTATDTEPEGARLVKWIEMKRPN